MNKRGRVHCQLTQEEVVGEKDSLYRIITITSEGGPGENNQSHASPAENVLNKDREKCRRREPTGGGDLNYPESLHAGGKRLAKKGVNKKTFPAGGRGAHY